MAVSLKFKSYNLRLTDYEGSEMKLWREMTQTVFGEDGCEVCMFNVWRWHCIKIQNKNVPIVSAAPIVALCVVVGPVIISVTMINNSDVKHKGSRALDQINAYDHTRLLFPAAQPLNLKYFRPHLSNILGLINQIFLL